jgi:hypothetical protein
VHIKIEVPSGLNEKVEEQYFVDFDLQNLPSDTFMFDDNKSRLTSYCFITNVTDYLLSETTFVPFDEMGRAVCAPMDKFDRKKGRTLALARAFRANRKHWTRARRKAVVEALKAKGMKLW